jgi:hypothetical protein
MPLRPHDLPNFDSEETQLHSRTIHEISTMYTLFDQTDDHEDDIRSPLPSSLSRLKGKQPEHDSIFDVSRSPAHDCQRFYPESSPKRGDELSGTRHPVFDSGPQEDQVAGPSLNPWDYSKPTTVTADDEPSISVTPRPLLLPLSHHIERSPPLLWSPLSLTVSHTPPPFYDSHDIHLRSSEEERVARNEFSHQFDYTSNLSSDTCVSTPSSPYGWVDSDPSSPVGVFVTPHDDLPPFPTVDNSDGPLLFDLSSDANIEFAVEPLLESTRSSPKTATAHYKCKRLFVIDENEFAGEPLLESMRSSPKIRGEVIARYKRKRLFLIDEDEYGESACKRRCIEQ